MIITRNIKLLPQRQEILKLLCDGKSCKEIAKKMEMNELTIKQNITDMKEINDCMNTTQLVYKYARSMGIENKTLY